MVHHTLHPMSQQYIECTMIYSIVLYSNVHALAKQDPRSSDQPVTIVTKKPQLANIYLVTTLTHWLRQIYKCIECKHLTLDNNRLDHLQEV